MDEKLEITESQFTVPLPIPDEENVYRQVKYDKGEKELSVNLASLCSVEEAYYIIRLSHDFKDDFKDIKKYKLFSIPIHIIRSIKEIEKVLHTPVFSGNPADIGKPNIYSHASIYFSKEEQVEVRKKLSTYCNQNFSDSYKEVDYLKISPIIESLRERKQNTKYHRCLNEVSSNVISS